MTKWQRNSWQGNNSTAQNRRRRLSVYNKPLQRIRFLRLADLRLRQINIFWEWRHSVLYMLRTYKSDSCLDNRPPLSTPKHHMNWSSGKSVATGACSCFCCGVMQKVLFQNKCNLHCCRFDYPSVGEGEIPLQLLTTTIGSLFLCLSKDDWKQEFPGYLSALSALSGDSQQCRPSSQYSCTTPFCRQCTSPAFIHARLRM